MANQDRVSVAQLKLETKRCNAEGCLEPARGVIIGEREPMFYFVGSCREHRDGLVRWLVREGCSEGQVVAWSTWEQMLDAGAFDRGTVEVHTA